MKISVYSLACFSLSLLCINTTATLSAKTEWDPIPAADLAQTECKSYPGSVAEVLFYRITYNSAGASARGGSLQNWSEYYQRNKIYSPQGAQGLGVMAVEYRSKDKVREIYARVTKPDGRATEYDIKAFSESLMEKKDGYKWMRLTLAVPDLGVGDIVEMKWAQSRDVSAYSYTWWYCQRNLPTREFILDVEGSSSGYQIEVFNAAKFELKRISSQHGRLEVKDMPPYEEEAFTPPERDARGWVMLLYTSEYFSGSSDDDIWENHSSYWAENFRLQIRTTPAIKAKAAELLSGVSEPEEKLRKLYEFCQQEIQNMDYSDSAELQLAKKKLEKEKGRQDAEETLKRRNGYKRHVNALFAALARAAGFDVRLALCASRSETLSVKNKLGWVFMDDELTAVRTGETWRLYAPGDYYIPFGLLPHSNEYATALVCDEDKVIYEQVPVAPASQTLVSRRGRFTLDLEGTLEGDVEERWGGHVGAIKKGDWNEKTQEEIDANFRESLSKRFSTAEVSDLKWENLRSPGTPLVARYKIKIPGYAELAGSRIIVVPSFFEHGNEPVFSSEQRKHPIFFTSARSEHDEVEITPPEGYTLDGGSAPANVGDPAGPFGVQYKLGYRPKQRLLVYKRDFALGGNSVIAFAQQSYPTIKAIFDAIKKNDEHSLVFKPKPAASPTNAPATAPASTQ